MRNEMGDKIAMWIKSAAAAIGGAAAYLWGPWDALITALIALVAIDYGTGVICAAVILFYTANEAISIMENAAELGLPVPKRLKGMLTKAQNESEAE